MKPEDDSGSTLLFTAQPPTQDALAFLLEDKMFDIVGCISTRLLGPAKYVLHKSTLEKKFSDPDEQARVAPLLSKLNLADIKPSDLGKVLDAGYYKRNCTSHANDAELERQVKKFIGIGGVAMLQNEFPIECALLQAFDDIKGQFL
ncbi:hypothetical protein Agub_g8082 [Astrephomene gubernaculifera]|uniref:Uncharacterized protein n=1 Tax=Astrephomene gubernaculifera TaxID=47775 RepID=A0AAD3DT17_9CHLO|nr:hypothetical protein Agub_g8082 [Astrephomene gubernaculifera]